jgi:hypothetical protein
MSSTEIINTFGRCREVVCAESAKVEPRVARNARREVIALYPIATLPNLSKTSESGVLLLWSILEIMNLRHLIACILLASSAFAQPAVFSSRKAQSDVAPTADPGSRFWRDAPGITVTTDYAGKPVPNNRMEARSRWTPTHLYILFICHFDELNLKPNPTTLEETNQLWNWDVAEAFLGSDFNDIARYKEFEVSPQGEWVDLDIDRSPQKRAAGIAWNSGFETKARIDRAKKVWYGEMKIPFDKLGIGSPAAGTKFRAGIYRCAGREPARELISWQATGARSFHVPERFGILALHD